MIEQLELFKVLNTEQQSDVNSFVERQNQQVVDRVASIKKMIDLLTKNKLFYTNDKFI